MENPIVAALVISLLGMPLLFLALAFFYGLLSLLPLVVRERAPRLAGKEGTAGRVAGPPPAAQHTVAAQRAVAVAVALARAESEAQSEPAVPFRDGEGTGVSAVSAWWASHHQRRLISHTRRTR